MSRLKLSFIVQYPKGERQVDLVGQFARTMRELVCAGSDGITSGEVSNQGWGYRLGHYVHILRKKYDVEIETLREEHNGEAGKGWHGRYNLLTKARLLKQDETLDE